MMVPYSYNYYYLLLLCEAETPDMFVIRHGARTGSCHYDLRFVVGLFKCTIACQKRPCTVAQSAYYMYAANVLCQLPVHTRPFFPHKMLGEFPPPQPVGNC